MRRRALIVGNWKMNGLIETAMELAAAVRAGLSKREKRQVLCEVVICPPFTALHAVHQLLGDSSLKLGAQNMAAESSGAFTGEIGGLMLRNAGCRYVILGHSERRRLYGEDNATVARKVAAAFRDGLHPIACLGETLAEREAGHTLEVIADQLDAVLGALPAGTKQQQLVVAYEPVWAIGTGKNATPEQIQEVHGAIRQRLAAAWGKEPAHKARILYGGSLNAGNAAGILALTDVDGGLIGGASLKAHDFLAIIDALPCP